MFNLVQEKITWGGRELTLETGKIARQADGSVLVKYGETVVLCTAVGQKTVNPEIDFFPLTVIYQEKAFAGGKIPGGFFKREGKPSEREILVSRLIDRPIRPLFPERFRNEIQIVCTTLSHDLENDPDIPALVGASAALAISGIPFLSPIGAARVAYVDGQYILNPTYEEMSQSKLDLVVAGASEGVLMVESEASQLSEEIMLNAVMFGFEHFQPVIKAIENLKAKASKEPWPLPTPAEYELEAYEKVKEIAEQDLREAYREPVKQKRHDKIEFIREKVREGLRDNEFLAAHINSNFKALEYNIVREEILKHGRRIDGRDAKSVRPISCEVGILPRAHGSALFTRGETQVLAVTTLGTGQDEQTMDELQGERKERFMLHYNFPPYSVGEVGRMSGPGRREIGHGKLAWRAIHPLLPPKEAFPYTLRVVSEVTESNGSSSMGSVCAGSLCLMDAGVPLPHPVAGIAMGLIKEENNDNYVVLTDILGAEDHLGDMDFKVAGTENGVTALQMDIKITSITREIMEIALKQAREGRLHILGEMNKSMGIARTDVSDYAPRMTAIMIPKDKIGVIIGPGGANIRELCETTKTKIDIEEDGKVNIAGADAKSIDAAVERIQSIIAEPEMGTIYKGAVAKTVEFGAFVNFLGNRSGLVHISELAPHRVGKVEDIVKAGDSVFVKVIGFEGRDKVRLSMKAVDQQTGQPLEAGVPRDA